MTHSAIVALLASPGRSNDPGENGGETAVHSLGLVARPRRPGPVAATRCGQGAGAGLGVVSTLDR